MELGEKLKTEPVAAAERRTRAYFKDLSGHSGEEPDENSGVESARFGEHRMEGAIHHLDRTRKRRRAASEEQTLSNRQSRRQQRKNIGQDTIQNRRAAAAGRSIGTGNKMRGRKKFRQTLRNYVRTNPGGLVLLAALGILVMLVAGLTASISVLFQGGGNVVLGTSYTAEDTDILGTETDYIARENALRSKLNEIEAERPGFDEYDIEADEIGHDPRELAAYLTVALGSYGRAEAEPELDRLITGQYDFRTRRETEHRTRKEVRTGTHLVADPVTGAMREEEYQYEVRVGYEYKILHVTLENHGLGSVVAGLLSGDALERWALLMRTGGNRPDLFPGMGEGPLDYQVPAEALTNTAFANMIREAEKYLGYPYVWGGSSPETSFDCSGFVSWVVNHCGNGWSVGRRTVNGFLPICDMIEPEKARPGDLVFFHSTFETEKPGPTHIGIYVGDGMMIHCGSPISYTSIETAYWQAHLYGFGRLRRIVKD